MLTFNQLNKELKSNEYSWLITGVSGFIGSNILETLLKLNQSVIGLDNYSTGTKINLEEVKSIVSPEQWSKFTMIEGDIRDLEICQEACNGIDFVLHQAALGSVPRSIDDPRATNDANINGFLNMLIAARDNNVKSFTYAASSSTYGDSELLPKVEEKIGRPLSPYAVTKLVNELYAEVFSRVYDFHSIGLRYFNVFGRRQNKMGPYSAVIPTWTSAMVNQEDIYINGDGETSRDFCYVDNVIQANLLASFADPNAKNEVYNVAIGTRTSLNQLFLYLKESLLNLGVDVITEPIYREFRAGDVKFSEADISKAQKFLGYHPTHQILEGLKESVPWYLENK